jgi:hypothetical protein
LAQGRCAIGRRGEVWRAHLLRHGQTWPQRGRWSPPGRAGHRASVPRHAGHRESSSARAAAP